MARVVAVRIATEHTDSDAAYRAVACKLKEAGFVFHDWKIDYDGLHVEIEGATVMFSASLPGGA